ncbi:MAG: short-chain dehydrogenase [Rhodospirillaceae bacterium]|nr:short-chain dehydrogenase [Rhodospirillaceae bacterium]|tara:strand:+ start:10830 stop:11555 length:726 start_codon:yes stop_codon:yes gene_type:complete
MSNIEGGAAVIIGAGDGLGAGLARQFSMAGMEVAVASRSVANAQRVAHSVPNPAREHVHGYACDATDEQSVAEFFNTVSAELGQPDVVIYNASGFLMKSVLEIEVDELTRQWNVTCLGGFIVGREAARRMTDQGSGSIIFTGATACYKGSGNFAGFAVGKFGLRALAQSMARELGPQGVHVAIVNIDGEINGPAHAHQIPEQGIDSLLDPDAIAETYLAIHRQHHTAWTHEVDLRPAIERW